jgi:hypothetical protein
VAAEGTGAAHFAPERPEGKPAAESLLALGFERDSALALALASTLALAVASVLGTEFRYTVGLV